MVATIEKNDVDISKIFHSGDKFDLVNASGKKVKQVYIRLVGDAELNRARVFALRSSADMRRELKTEGSEMRTAFIPYTFEDFETSELIDLVSALSVQEINRRAFKEVNIPIPAEPDSDASLEKQEEYQKIVDEYPKKRYDAIREFIDKELILLKKNLEGKSKTELGKLYENLMIASMCEQEMMNKFKEMCVYFGTFEDKEYRKRLFSSFEEFDNIQTDMKEQLLSYYSSLELTNDELKK